MGLWSHVLRRLLACLVDICQISLDFLIAMNKRYLRKILKEYKTHYDQGRPHSSLGPGFPEPTQGLPMPPQKRRIRLPEGNRIMAKPILGGLQDEYRLKKIAA